jgi:hypothetical protein
MTEKGKDKIVTISASFITSIIVVLVSFGLSGRRIESAKIQEKINLKVDKTVFLDNKRECEMRFEKIENNNQKVIDLLNNININATESKVEIMWIKRELERQR